MIVTEIYNGQGLGNQLWCYVTTRVIAKDRDYDFGIQSPGKFKCIDFLNLDFGKPVIGGIGPEGGPPLTLPEGITHYYKEKKITHPNNNMDISIYDSQLLEIPDNTKIDGNMQDEQYILHRKNEIQDWLKVNEAYECYDFSDDDTCVINFRGGEYVDIKNVFLPQKYWDDAIRFMQGINKDFKFIVITDDPKTAKKFFPKYDVFHFSIAKDYVIIKNAKYLILANSSFAWFPAWLNVNLKFCIAPKYWWAHNISDGFWACGYNITKDWYYLDRNGKLQDYETCLKELHVYTENHKQYYIPVKINKNFLVISNYNNNISWVPERTDQYVVYDKSETNIYPYTIDKSKVIKSPNIGYNLYDYFSFIIDHYDNLPECTIFTKGNIFPRHVTQAYFDTIANNNFFTPIEDCRMHKAKWPISYFSSDGGFCEINNSWYLNHHFTKYFHDYNDFLRFCFKNPVIPTHIRFAPGGNYIVPKGNVLKLPKVFYENLRTFVSHCPLPGEAHIVERALHTLWTCNFEINDTMLRPLDEEFVAIPPQSKMDRLRRGLSLNKINPRSLLNKYIPRPIKKAMRKFINHIKAFVMFDPLGNLHLSLSDITGNIKNIFKKKESTKEIAEYRKTIKIYDVFYFFNELELLEIRFNILDDYVDYFVIIEATESFSGFPHKLCYEENKKRFAKWKDKIIYYIVDDFPKDLTLLEMARTNSNTGAGEHYWIREFYQKESAKKAITHLEDNDIVFVSDLDEIWNPLRLKELTDFSKSKIIRPKQLAYYYFLNNRCSEKNGWTGTIVTKYKTIKDNCLNDLRTRSKTKFIEVASGGWHFGFMGGIMGAMNKLTEWQHPVYMNWIPTLEERVKKNIDYRGRKYRYWIDETELPKYLLENKSKYLTLFK